MSLYFFTFPHPFHLGINIYISFFSVFNSLLPSCLRTEIPSISILPPFNFLIHSRKLVKISSIIFSLILLSLLVSLPAFLNQFSLLFSFPALHLPSVFLSPFSFILSFPPRQIGNTAPLIFFLCLIFFSHLCLVIRIRSVAFLSLLALMNDPAQLINVSSVISLLLS